MAITDGRQKRLLHFIFRVVEEEGIVTVDTEKFLSCIHMRISLLISLDRKLLGKNSHHMSFFFPKSLCVCVVAVGGWMSGGVGEYCC